MELVYARAYRYYKLAVTAERKIKQFTRRQKERLMNASASASDGNP